jgi:hypothetical protein
MSSQSTFIELALRGEVVQDEIDDFVDEWHDDEQDDRALHEFLGMTQQEYELWVEQPGSLRLILAARNEGAADLYGAIARYAEMEPVTARAADPEAAKVVLGWLRKTGRIT